MARVLVVDDEPDLRRFYEITLQKRGHDVVAVETGEEAIELFKLVYADRSQVQFDSVLMDYRLPGMNGAETGRRIFAINPDQKLMFITAYDRDLLRELGTTFKGVNMGNNKIHYAEKDSKLIGKMLKMIENRKEDWELAP